MIYEVQLLLFSASEKAIKLGCDFLNDARHLLKFVTAQGDLACSLLSLKCWVLLRLLLQMLESKQQC